MYKLGEANLRQSASNDTEDLRYMCLRGYNLYKEIRWEGQSEVALLQGRSELGCFTVLYKRKGTHLDIK